MNARSEDPDLVSNACREYARARVSARHAFAEAAAAGRSVAGRRFHRLGIKWSRIARTIKRHAVGEIRDRIRDLDAVFERDAKITKLDALRAVGLTGPIDDEPIWSNYVAGAPRGYAPPVDDDDRHTVAIATSDDAN